MHNTILRGQKWACFSFGFYFFFFSFVPIHNSKTKRREKERERKKQDDENGKFFVEHLIESNNKDSHYTGKQPQLEKKLVLNYMGKNRTNSGKFRKFTLTSLLHVIFFWFYRLFDAINWCAIKRDRINKCVSLGETAIPLIGNDKTSTFSLANSTRFFSSFSFIWLHNGMLHYSVVSYESLRLLTSQQTFLTIQINDTANGIMHLISSIDK